MGAERCRLCHRAVYERWERTSHARTRAGGTAGETCLVCHTTGGERLLGVQCEACHGADGNYWPAEIMIDPDKAAMAGLRRPTEELCLRCHDNEEPGHATGFEMPAPDEWVSSVH